MSQYSYNPNNQKQNNYYLPIFLSIALVVGIVIGYIVSINNTGKQSLLKQTEYDKIQNILDFAQIYYVDSVDREALVEETIEKLLSNLDPHSYYISAKDLKAVNEDLQGNFEGIGVEFSIINDTILIITPISGGPSEELGILAGDKIIAIDDSTVAGVGVKNQDVMAMLKGPKGSKVDVKVLRSGNQKLDFTIKRDKIPIYSVDAHFMVDDEIGFLRFNRFSATTYDEFLRSVRSLQEQGMQKLILDLRQNPGGYLGAAVQIADEFLDGKRIVVYTEGRNTKKINYYAERPGYFEQGDLVILIDQNSASSSEIVAGAVQDWDRGLIVGRRSFGKGLVQEQFTLRDASALRLTIARYYTPSGRSIQKPYTGSDDYYEEVYARYDNGELLNAENIELEDSTIYYTQIKKREVYGGGGIFPDIFVPLDTSLFNFYVNRLRSYVPEFIYSYYSSENEQFKQYKTAEDFNKKYRVNDVLFNDFISFCEEKGWEGDKELLSNYKETIKNVLKALIAKQLFKNDGYFMVMNQRDPVVLEAVKQLKKGIDLSKPYDSNQ